MEAGRPHRCGTPVQTDSNNQAISECQRRVTEFGQHLANLEKKITDMNVPYEIGLLKEQIANLTETVQSLENSILIARAEHDWRMPADVNGPLFSLILPSRARTNELNVFLQSVSETVSVPDAVEAWIALDQDDEKSLASYAKWKTRFKFANFYIGPRQENMSAGYYSALCEHARGKYIWALNDDCILTVRGWDVAASWLFQNVLKRFPDGIWYGKTHEPKQSYRFSCFPLLTRQAIDAAGWFFNPRFPAWGADVNLYDIWNSLGRVVDCPMLCLRHNSPHQGGRLPDLHQERMAKISSYDWEGKETEIERIRQTIEARKYEWLPL